MGKSFLFYPNWCNFTEVLPLASIRGKSLKTGSWRLRHHIIQPKLVTLATAVLFSGVAPSRPSFLRLNDTQAKDRNFEELKAKFVSLYSILRIRPAIS